MCLCSGALARLATLWYPANLAPSRSQPNHRPGKLLAALAITNKSPHREDRDPSGTCALASLLRPASEAQCPSIGCSLTGRHASRTASHLCPFFWLRSPCHRLTSCTFCFSPRSSLAWPLFLHRYLPITGDSWDSLIMTAPLLLYFSSFYLSLTRCTSRGPVFDFFPAYAARKQDPRKHAITLRHLLSLQTGYPKDSAIIWLFRSLADERGERKFAPAQLSSSISTNSLGFLRINSPISLSVVGAMVWNAALSWLMEVNNSASSSKSQGRGSRWCVAPC